MVRVPEWREHGASQWVTDPAIRDRPSTVVELSHFLEIKPEWETVRKVDAVEGRG